MHPIDLDARGPLCALVVCLSSFKTHTTTRKSLPGRRPQDAKKSGTGKEKAYKYQHRKNSFWKTFLPSMEKLFPGQWSIQKTLFKNQESHILDSTTEIFPLWPPFLLSKKTSSTGQGGVRFSLSLEKVSNGRLQDVLKTLWNEIVSPITLSWDTKDIYASGLS